MKKYFLLLAFLTVGALIALKFREGANQDLTQIVENTENAMNRVATNVTEQVETAVDTAQNGAAEVAENAAETARGAVENVANKAAEVTTQVVSEAKENVQTIGQDAQQALNGAATSVGNAAKDIADQLQAKLVRDANGTISKINVPTIEFEANQAVLKESSKPALNELATLISQTKEINRIRVEGYTDNSGNPLTNTSLSQKRADAVVSYLSQAGIQKEKFESKGFGSENPLTSNDTPEGRSANRRVEFKVIQ